MIAKTILYAEHDALSAHIVDFHGWLMPLHYGSQLQEHQFVRQDAGMFDVSHMTVIDISGPEDRHFLRHLLSADIDNPRHSGHAVYTCMCNTHGGIIDDLIVYPRQPAHYRLVLNSATRSRDLAWIREQIKNYKVDIQERPDLAMIAVQGPEAIRKTLAVLTSQQAETVSTLSTFESAEVDNYFIARTGYTGEDGLEIIAPHADILLLWKALLAMGVKPCGLAARDSLRVEAGLLLYGQDMDESTTPLDSALGWTVSWDPKDREFIGRTALLSQKKQGLLHKLVGITLQEKGMLRTGQRVVVDGLADGIITSGSFSPSLGQSIGFARVPFDTPNTVQIDIRNKHYLASVGPLRFINKRTVL